MAKVGLKYPVFAPISTDVAGSLPTYGTGVVVGKAMEAGVTINRSDSKLYADDDVAESDKSFLSGAIKLGVDDIDNIARVVMLGSQSKTVDTIDVIRDAATYGVPLGGFGYYRIRKKNGVRSIRAFWYPKTQWVEPSEEAKTKGENIEWQTPTIEGEIFKAKDAEETWRDKADFATEVEAVSWLDEKANIGEPASLTALNASVSAAQAEDPEAYTSASWVAVANTLADAVVVQGMESPSQSRVDAAKSALDAAVAALIIAV